MSLISFEFQKPYFYFLLVWILNAVNAFLSDLRFIKYQTCFMTLNLIYMNFGELMSGFLVLYTKLKMNHLQKKETITTNRNKAIEPELIYNDLSLKKNIKILIFLVSLLDCIGRSYIIIFLFIFNKYSLEKHHMKWIISTDLLARILFCRIMLKTKLYKHHKISINICIFGFLIMAFMAFQSMIFEKDGKYNLLCNWFLIIFTIIQKLLFSLEDTISKILLTNKFVLPHYLMFFKSIITFILYIIIMIILFSTSKITTDHLKALLEIKNFGLYIGFIIFKIVWGFLLGFSIFKVIDIFTPIHIGFLNIVSSIFEIIKITSEKSESEYILYYLIFIICFVIIGIGGLIFTEILIVNACGLNEYTKVGLLIKEKLDRTPPNSSVLVDINDDKSEFYDNDRSDIVGSVVEPNNSIMFSYKKKRYSNI